MVIIESVIKIKSSWTMVHRTLNDTMKEESMEICLDINEYAQKIEMMGEEYGGEVEVAWSTEDNVTPEQINEVRQQIMAYEAEIEAQQQNATHMPDGTPIILDLELMFIFLQKVHHLKNMPLVFPVTKYGWLNFLRHKSKALLLLHHF